MAFKYDESFIEKIVEVCGPFFKNRRFPLVPDVLEPAYYSQYCPDEVLVYTKLRSLILAKIRQTLFGLRPKFYTEITSQGGVLMYEGAPASEEVAQFVWDERYSFPATGSYFWVDDFLIDGEDIPDEESIYDCYLTEGTSIEVDFKGCQSLKEMKKRKGGKAFCKDVAAWYKEPYQDEMAEATAELIRVILSESCYETCNMKYQINVNVAIVPFFKWCKKNHKAYHNDEGVRLAIALIECLKYPCYLMHTSVCGDSYGFTKNLFWNLMCYGYEEDAELIRDNIRLRCEIAFMVIDQLLACLDMKYDFLPANVKDLYLQEERDEEAA